MVAASTPAARVAAYAWRALRAQLDETGVARLPGLVSPQECEALLGHWEDRGRFRSEVSLDHHRYGEAGEYRYFADPLPRLVSSLRTALYARLAPLANRWQERLGRPDRHPPGHRAYRAMCHEAGQRRPTPLLLRYREGGLNFLHQDQYGALAFPFQVVAPLSVERRDYEGGEFLLVEQRPRQQSRGVAIRLAQGEGLIFPNRERPIAGQRGDYAATLRHGMSRVLRGERAALGIIFHDAR